jgi:hypothetical protein
LLADRDERAIFSNNPQHLLSQAESAQQRLADLNGVARVSSARVVAQLLLEYAHAKMNSDYQTNLRYAVSAMFRLQRQRSVGVRTICTDESSAPTAIRCGCSNSMLCSKCCAWEALSSASLYL